MNDPQRDQQALENLRRVVQDEPSNAFAWRLAATAYGRQGDKGMLSLAMAERRDRPRTAGPCRTREGRGQAQNRPLVTHTAAQAANSHPNTSDTKGPTGPDT